MLPITCQDGKEGDREAETVVAAPRMDNYLDTWTEWQTSMAGFIFTVAGVLALIYAVVLAGLVQTA